MRRRDILRLLGSAAITAPCAALAQTAPRTYRVGSLTAIGPMGDNSPFGAPLVRGLAQHGYVQGRNLVFERRGAQGRLDRLPDFVKELVASKVDVIVTLGYPPALAAKRETTLPVVAIAAGDPVAAGLVNSLARPGGNLTGVSDVASELTSQAHGVSQGDRARAAPGGYAVECGRCCHDPAVPGFRNGCQCNGYRRPAARRAWA